MFLDNLNEVSAAQRCCLSPGIQPFTGGRLNIILVGAFVGELSFFFFFFNLARLNKDSL